jgi:DNA mismatch endonuclease (patch repair protein)
MARTWSSERPADIAWRCVPGLSRTERAREQDEAAGGHEYRVIHFPDGGTATASVCLRLPAKVRRVYAYLRWSADGGTDERYVGEVHGESRRENLAEAWRIVRERGLTDAPPAESGAPDETSADSWASSPAVRAVMRANKNKDTKPELRLRSAAHALGLRYRVSARPLPTVRRTADLVFAGPKVAVFLDGCFWHGCPDHHRPAKRNSEFWTTKIDGNRKRDRETDRKLVEAGWVPVRIWEHEDPVEAAGRVAEIVRERAVHRHRRSSLEGEGHTSTKTK